MAYNLSRAFGHQLREPRGWAGRLTGVLMRLLNHDCNRLAVQALAIGPADTLLELGFGPGHAVALMANQARAGRVYGVDISQVMMEQAIARNRSAVRSGRVVLQQGSFEALPFADHSMSGVLAVNVAYFWAKGAAIANEARRVLRPNGRLVVYVTDRATMSHWSFAGPGTHVHWDAAGLLAMLSAGGFRLESIEVRKVRLRGGVQGLLAVARAAE